MRLVFTIFSDGSLGVSLFFGKKKLLKTAAVFSFSFLSCSSFSRFCSSFCRFSSSFCLRSSSFCLRSSSFCLRSSSFCLRSSSFCLRSSSFCFFFSSSLALRSSSFCRFSSFLALNLQRKIHIEKFHLKKVTKKKEKSSYSISAKRFFSFSSFSLCFSSFSSSLFFSFSCQSNIIIISQYHMQQVI